MASIVTSSDFKEKVLDNPLPVLVDFFATWCGPCRRVAPVVDQIAEERAGSVAVYKLDIDQSRDVAERYNVMSVPTLMVFQNGQVVSTAIGARPKPAPVCGHACSMPWDTADSLPRPIGSKTTPAFPKAPTGSTWLI